MRVLITGASGFLGRNLLLALPRSWDVVAPYRPSNPTFLPFLRRHGLDQVAPVACDLTREDEVLDAARQVAGQQGDSFDGCIYLASNTSIPGSIDQPIADLTTNVIGLLHTLRAWSFERLVYLSSGAVYMGLDGLVGPECRLTPTLPYAISKLAAEHYLHAGARHQRNPAHATIVRFFGAFGPYEPPRKVYTKLVRRFAFERNPEFAVLGDGENYIDAMYIDDAVRSLLAVLEQPMDGVRTVDLGLGTRMSVNELVRRAGRAFGLEPRIAHQGSSPEYITFSIDPAPFQAHYRVVPEIGLEEGLLRFAAFLKQEEPGDVTA